MRDVGLLDVRTDGTGGVGRPQHLYSLAADAPSLGLEPPTYPLLARMLLETAAAAGVAPDEAAEIGRAQGRADSARYADAPSCLEALVRELDVLGFDPAVDGSDDGEIAVIGFAHCPFRELAEAHPELVCALHRGMVEGFVEQTGGGGASTTSTRSVDRDPCQVTYRSQPSRTFPLVITLTESAASKVSELIDAEGDPTLALRVAVRPGGCSGF